jgi:pilus assembly protein CpaC
VLSLVTVGGGSQVLLEARIAEVARNRVRELGVQTNISTTSGGNPIKLFSGNASTTGFGAGASFDGSKVDVNLQALEQEGAAKVLAEPNLVALSGQEASFLVGGEFPVPIAQSGAAVGSISIDYKQFGVGLKFTPTVLSPDQISLKLATEVSAIDDTTGTSVLGTTVPGLRTRRAATTIEMGDGQAFAVAGLLQDDLASVVSRFPGLGSIPLLGSLFRSSEFKNRRTELVVMVTPRLVKPVARAALALPTDGVEAPSPFDQYLMGRPLAPRQEPAQVTTPAEPATKDGARF